MQRGTPGHNVGSKKDTIMLLTLTNYIFFEKKTLPLPYSENLRVVFRGQFYAKTSPVASIMLCTVLVEATRTIPMQSCVTHPSFPGLGFFLQWENEN